MFGGFYLYNEVSVVVIVNLELIGMMMVYLMGLLNRLWMDMGESEYFRI